MMVLITYDVNTETAAGKKRLTKMAKNCMKYGQRVQNSVFECIIETALFKQAQEQLEKIMDKDHDSLRFYFLGDDWKTRVYHVGTKKSVDLEGTLIL